MAQSTDYLDLQVFRTTGDSTFYDHAGAGVWVSVAGFAVTAVGGLVLAVTSPRR